MNKKFRFSMLRFLLFYNVFFFSNNKFKSNLSKKNKAKKFVKKINFCEVTNPTDFDSIDIPIFLSVFFISKLKIILLYRTETRHKI